MIFEKGNMWDMYQKTDLFVITTCSYIKRNGCLVMGRGIAQRAKERIPDIAINLGNVIGNKCEHLGIYGVVVLENPIQPIGAFQVKQHHLDPADLKLIRRSVRDLSTLAMTRYTKRIDMNFPGIGYGRLSRERVLPIIDALPDNVHVWEYKK